MSSLTPRIHKPWMTEAQSIHLIQGLCPMNSAGLKNNQDTFSGDFWRRILVILRIYLESYFLFLWMVWDVDMRPDITAAILLQKELQSVKSNLTHKGSKFRRIAEKWSWGAKDQTLPQLVTTCGPQMILKCIWSFMIVWVGVMWLHLKPSWYTARKPWWALGPMNYWLKDAGLHDMSMVICNSKDLVLFLVIRGIIEHRLEKCMLNDLNL